jgi:ParB/RepB/Spo0J family partition protein
MENTVRSTVEIKEINAGNIPSIEAIRKFAVKRGREPLHIAYKDIYVRPGFNARIEYGDLEALADSIHENGLEYPLKVDIVEEDGQIKAYINEGHRRHAAFGILIERGIEVKSIECIVNPKGTTEEDRIFTMFVTQDNKPLEALEIAECFHRLKNLGHQPEQIAKRIGKSVTYVKNYLDIAKEPMEVKMAIHEKRLSPSAAIVLRKRIPSEKARKAAVSNLNKEGKKFKVRNATELDKGSPDFIASRIKILEQHLEFFPDYKQAQARVLINFLIGDIDVSELIAVNVSNPV